MKKMKPRILNTLDPPEKVVNEVFLDHQVKEWQSNFYVIIAKLMNKEKKKSIFCLLFNKLILEKSK